jgi:hypothetical protein
MGEEEESVMCAVMVAVTSNSHARRKLDKATLSSKRICRVSVID